MNVLALETSERIGSLAILETQDKEIQSVQTLRLAEDCRSAQSLLPELKTMLSSKGWGVDQLDLICVTTGPGSFTGLRIGVTVAKTLAFATGAKLAGINTLNAIAASVQEYGSRLWTIIDAQRQELFVACYQQPASIDSTVEPKISVVSIDSWLTKLEAGDTVAGSPLHKIADRLPSSVNVTDSSTWAPQAEFVGRLGVQAYHQDCLSDPMQLTPHYYRQSAAEEKADALG